VSTSAAPLHLDGSPLDFAALATLASGRCAVSLDAAALTRVATGRAALEAAISAGVPVYGATTGVGALKDWTPSTVDVARFNADLVNAHCFGVGAPLPAPVTRLAMAIRVNTALSGYAAATPGFIERLAAWLNAGLTPLVRPLGSLGCGDIGLMAQIGAALAGEGEVMLSDQRLPAMDAIVRAGLEPFSCGVKDSLVALSSNATSVALAASTLRSAASTLRTLMATGLTSASAMGSLSAPATVAVRLGTPRQATVGRWLLSARDGSRLAAAARVHDPLSIRMMTEVFAAGLDAVEAAGRVALSGTAQSDDNPVVIDGAVLSTGGSLPLDLTLAIEATALALAHVGRSAMNRCILMANGRLVGLPVNLAPPERSMTGFGPALKLAGDLYVRIQQLAMPVSTQPVVVADGMEDEATFLPLALDNLIRQLDALDLLGALEALLAAAALDATGQSADGLAGRVYTAVRRHAAPHHRDRPISMEIETIARDLASDVRHRELIAAAPLDAFDSFFAIDADHTIQTLVEPPSTPSVLDVFFALPAET
jgi:histidine ammonia-lyase